MKVCTKCNKQLPDDQFHKNKVTKDGLHSNCKRCRLLYMQPAQIRYYENNKDRIKLLRQEYYQKNKEKINQTMKAWKEKNKEKYIQYHTEYNDRKRKQLKIYEDFYLQHYK